MSAAELRRALDDAGGPLVSEDMRPSGWFQRVTHQPNEVIPEQTWSEQVDGLVHAFDRFAGELSAEERATVVEDVDGPPALSEHRPERIRAGDDDTHPVCLRQAVALPVLRPGFAMALPVRGVDRDEPRRPSAAERCS